MDLGLSAEQRLLVDTARSFLERSCPIEHVRAMERDEQGFDAGLWREMGRLGWLGIALPGEHGGSGQSFLDVTLLLEQMGRVLLPSPFLVTCAVAAPLLQALGNQEQRGRWLTGIARGEIVASVAVFEPGERDEWHAPQLAARPDRDGFRLEGTKRLVPFAPHSDVVLVTARMADAGPCVMALERGVEGSSCTRRATLGGDHFYDLRLENVFVPLSARLGDFAAVSSAIEQMLLRAATGSLAYAVGAAERVLEMTVDHAKTRTQFGRPIGSFQAVAHRCVDVRSDIDALRYLVYQAAWSLAAARPSQLEVSAAKAYGNEALQRIFRNAHQVHGAIGFSTEHDLQLFTRRAKAAELQWGSTRFHTERVAKTMGL